MNPEDDLEARKAAADAVCSRVEDIMIVNGIPEYRPTEEPRDEIPERADLRAEAEVV